MSHAKQIQTYDEAAREIGFRVVTATISKHIKMTLVDDAGRTSYVVASSSPSDRRRYLHRFISDVRRSAR